MFIITSEGLVFHWSVLSVKGSIWERVWWRGNLCLAPISQDLERSFWIWEILSGKKASNSSELKWCWHLKLRERPDWWTSDSLEKFCWMRQVAAPKVQGDKCILWPFIPCYKACLGQLVFLCWCSNFCFSLLTSADHPITTVVCGSSSAGWRALEQHVCAGTEGQWHIRVCEIRLLSWQFALTILIITHICVCMKILWFRYINIYVYTCFGSGFFFYLQKKHNFLNFSLNWSTAQSPVLQRWWSGRMNLSWSNDLLN